MVEQLSTQALVFIVILIAYVLTSHLIEVQKVPFLHESAVAIMMGIIASSIAKFVFNIEIYFDNQIFFTIILPPIIFSAGYSLRKSLFFQNFGIICFLGIVGTIIGFLCLTLLLILLDNLIFHMLTLQEIMMISSVLCATDTVAAMALIKPQKYPTLNAVLFGQGIINDAVAIILFRTVSGLDLGQGNSFNFTTILQMIFSFCYLFFFSIALGLAAGFGLSYLFKVNPSFTKHPLKQASLILLTGYFIYLLGQEIRLSGIISLFTCAIIMGHYCFMNISQESQRGTGLAFQTVSYIAQAFIFAYLGASVFGVNGSWLAVGMSAAILISFPFIRALMVYVLPVIYSIRKVKFPLQSNQLKICWYSGMVRGVIAFALCLQIQVQNQKTQGFIQTITIVIVMFTTLLGATMLKTFAKLIGLDAIQNQDQQQGQGNNQIGDNLLQKNTQLTPAKYHSIGLYSDSQSSRNPNQSQVEQQVPKKQSNFVWFQKQYIKPIFQKQKLTYQLDEDIKQNNSKQIKPIQQNINNQNIK